MFEIDHGVDHCVELTDAGSLKPESSSPLAGHAAQSFVTHDKAVMQLLAKLDEGAHAVANLRSILAMKSAELNELIAQLELTNQTIHSVESSTAQIETILKEMGIPNDSLGSERDSMLLMAEASLDSAIKSASSLYTGETQSKYCGRRPSMVSNGSGSAGTDPERRSRLYMGASRRFESKIRYKPDTKHILRQLNELLRQLELDSGMFFKGIGTTDDVQVLQKAYVDLDIAKTIALSAKSNYKRREILLRSSRKRDTLEQVKKLGCKIREGETLWRTYARNAPLLINDQDIISILDREDDLLAKNLPVFPSRMSIDTQSRQGVLSNSASSNTRMMRTSISSRSTDSLGSAISRPSHSRTPSMQDSATRALLPAPIEQTQPTTSSKKTPHRNSLVSRPHTVRVAVSTGTRVRTHPHTVSTKRESNPPAVKTFTRPPSTRTIEESAIPLPPSLTTSNDSPAPLPDNNDSGKKNALLKPPSQRGPGSTLRLRSMLAKRLVSSQGTPLTTVTAQTIR